MATPYLQHKIPSTRSTQDLAREMMTDLPVLVVAAEQTEGRGRSGAVWETAPRALAVSLAFDSTDDRRPHSLIAGVAAARVVSDVELKWPNDLIVGGLKVGGILVEKSDPAVVIGMGVNLWWPDPPDGYGSLYPQDPGQSAHVELGALWGAEMMSLLESDGWPRDEYRQACLTIGRQITWEPQGAGMAVGVSDDGGLVVDTEQGVTTIYSGAVRHVR